MTKSPSPSPSTPAKEASEPERGKITVKAVVRRSNGQVEDLGVISEGWVKLDSRSTD